MDPAALFLDSVDIAKPLSCFRFGFVSRAPAEHLVPGYQRQMVGELRLELGIEVAGSVVGWQRAGGFAVRHSWLARCTGCLKFQV